MKKKEASASGTLSSGSEMSSFCTEMMICRVVIMLTDQIWLDLGFLRDIIIHLENKSGKEITS